MTTPREWVNGVGVLVRATGEIEPVAPANGVRFTLRELQTLVGGYIEIVRCPWGGLMIVDEEGHLKRKRWNAAATLLAQSRDPIAGDVVLVERRDIEGEDDDDA